VRYIHNETEEQKLIVQKKEVFYLNGHGRRKSGVCSEELEKIVGSLFIDRPMHHTEYN
jgi:hypothetical protein